MKRMVGVLAFAVGVAVASIAAAQATGPSALVGTVFDPSGSVIPGATVIVEGDTLIGGTFVVQTDAEGRYRASPLAAGTYALAVSAPGFARARRLGIRLPAETKFVVDVRLEIAGMHREVTISAPAPTVDVTSAAAPTHLDQTVLQNVPTDRSIYSLINLVPGIGSDVAFGGTQGSNAFLVDGVDVTEPDLGTPWVSVSFNWLQEVQVSAPGAAAEYGQFTGAVLTAVLRSGTNRFSGLGEYQTTPGQWSSDNRSSLPKALASSFAPRQILAWTDTSAQLGGPVKRDRLWFFSGVQAYRHDDRPAGFAGPGSVSEVDPRFIAKAEYAARPGLRLEAMGQYDALRIDGSGAGRGRPIETTSDVRQPAVVWNVRASWSIGSRSLLDGRVGGFSGPRSGLPRPPATSDGPAPHQDVNTGDFSVNAPGFRIDDKRRHTASITVTHYADDFLHGRHEVKFGAEYERSGSVVHKGYPGGALYLDNGAEPYLAYLQQPYWIRTTASRTGAFAQDQWNLGGLTLTPGIRIDANRGSVPEKKDVFHTTPISVRLGAAWDVLADHSTVLRAHYGRYHDAAFSNWFSDFDVDGRTPEYTVQVLGPGQFKTLSQWDYTYGTLVDPKLKQSFVDQYIAGAERELFADASVQVQYIGRRFHDFMAYQNPAARWQAVAFPDPGPDGRLGTPDDGGMLVYYRQTNPGQGELVLTNPAGLSRRYDAVQVVARKRYSRNWQLQASYTWSRSIGDVRNLAHVNAGYWDASPGFAISPNTFLKNSPGHSPYDPQEVKALGTYRLEPWGGLNISAVYTWRSGPRSTRAVFVPTVGMLPAETVGSIRLPASNTLDLRVDKTFPAPKLGVLSLYIDAFNVWNQGIPTAIVVRSGSDFGQPIGWSDPRIVRFGTRWTF